MKIQEIINENPIKPIRAIAKDLKVSECTIRSVVHEGNLVQVMCEAEGPVYARCNKRALFNTCKVLAKQVETPNGWNALYFLQ